MIRVKNVTKAYGKTAIFQNLNLEIPECKITLVVGPNGAGKTSLLKCLLNLERYQGSITFNNDPLESVRNHISVVYDNSPLYSNLTGYQNLYLLSSIPFKQPDLCNSDLVPITLKDEILRKKVKTYSFGQKKKLSLMIALLHKPKYLFLDEVSNGLDYDSLIDFKQTLKQLSAYTTIIVIGHHLEYYSPIIDGLILLHNQSAITINDFKQNGGVDIREVYKQYFK